MWGADAALCDAAVGQVLLLGDIHNCRQVLDAALRTAGDEGCDVLVQVGYCWLQDANWRGFAPVWAGAMCCAVNAEVPVVVDGNHEVWPSLTAFQQRHDTVAARAGRCIWAVRCGGPTAAAPGVGQGGASARSAAARRRIDG